MRELLQRLQTATIGDCADTWACEALALAAVAATALIVDALVKRLLPALVRKASAKTRGRFDDTLLDVGFFDMLAHLAPVLVVYQGIALAGLDDAIGEMLRRLAAAATVIVILRAFSRLLDAVNAVYIASPEARQRPIKGYLQVVALVAWGFGAILVVAVLLDKSPALFLGGLGALSAVLLLVFKDTLLSLVASVQLTSNDMLRVGDWIEVPQHGADGDVEDIALHTVKVRNFDKTRTTIPTYALISQGFKNWRGMGEAGARRIRRAVYLDATSVRHLDDGEIARFARYKLLRDHMERKRRELAAHNDALTDDDAFGDRRRLTNLGTLRAYVLAYLRRRSDVRQDLTLLVRQLSPTPDGVPLEIYCFTATTDWIAYEDIQSDIFDHILASVPDFGLRVFQHPSGADFRVGLRAGTAQAS